jgi:hypothetical protein
MSMARLTFPSRLELNRPEGSFNAAPLANVILTTFLYVSPVQTMPPWEKTGSPHPLPLLDDLRVRLVDDCAHFREHLPAPVPKFLDLLVDKCRGRFHRDPSFHATTPTLAPNLTALSVTCNLRQVEASSGPISVEGAPF